MRKKWNNSTDVWEIYIDDPQDATLPKHGLPAAAYEWLLTPEIHYGRRLAESWNLRLAASTTYASDNYMESYFDVTPADSGRSGLSTFSASDGFRDVSVNLALSYDINENWDLGVLGSWKRLLGDAEDSPVTDVGNENQFIAGLFVTYSWSSR